MKATWVALVLLLCSSSVVAGEYRIDLKLKDLKLDKYQYSPAVDEGARIQFYYGSEKRSYFMYVPDSVSRDMPLVVALHGAGRSGASMIDAWKRCSDKHGFMVVAPNGVANNWDVAVDDADFINAATKAAVHQAGVKYSRKYLFGHSNGGRKAIALAALYPTEYTAVVAHAGTLPQLTQSTIKPVASNKPAVGLFLGDKDHIFSVASARETVAWLEKYSYPTSLYILQNHSHWYYEDFDRINESIWAFMKLNRE